MRIHRHIDTQTHTRAYTHPGTDIKTDEHVHAFDIPKGLKEPA